MHKNDLRPSQLSRNITLVLSRIFFGRMVGAPSILQRQNICSLHILPSFAVGKFQSLFNRRRYGMQIDFFFFQ